MFAPVTAGVGIVLQARMGSTRLPGKVLRPLAGRPMLDHIIERLRTCRRPGLLVVATSVLAADEPIVERCRALGVAVFRGSEADVLDRYRGCVMAHGLAHVVRATADNPFVDPEEVDRLVDLHLRDGNDYTASSLDPGGGLPVGVGVEAFSAAALERSWREGRAPNHREHVNEYIQENPARFRVGVSVGPPDKQAPGLRLTVDTADDFVRAERLLAAHARRGVGGFPDTAWLIEEAERG